MYPNKAKELVELLESFGGELNDETLMSWEQWLRRYCGALREETVAKLFAYARIGRDGVAELRKDRDAVVAETLRSMAARFDNRKE